MRDPLPGEVGALRHRTTELSAALAKKQAELKEFQSANDLTFEWQRTLQSIERNEGHLSGLKTSVEGRLAALGPEVTADLVDTINRLQKEIRELRKSGEASMNKKTEEVSRVSQINELLTAMCDVSSSRQEVVETHFKQVNRTLDYTTQLYSWCKLYLRTVMAERLVWQEEQGLNPAQLPGTRSFVARCQQGLQFLSDDVSDSDANGDGGRQLLTGIGSAESNALLAVSEAPVKAVDSVKEVSNRFLTRCETSNSATTAYITPREELNLLREMLMRVNSEEDTDVVAEIEKLREAGNEKQRQLKGQCFKIKNQITEMRLALSEMRDLVQLHHKRLVSFPLQDRLGTFETIVRAECTAIADAEKQELVEKMNAIIESEKEKARKASRRGSIDLAALASPRRQSQSQVRQSLSGFAAFEANGSFSSPQSLGVATDERRLSVGSTDGRSPSPRMTSPRGQSLNPTSNSSFARRPSRQTIRPPLVSFTQQNREDGLSLKPTTATTTAAADEYQPFTNTSVTSDAIADHTGTLVPPVDIVLQPSALGEQKRAVPLSSESGSQETSLREDGSLSEKLEAVGEDTTSAADSDKKAIPGSEIKVSVAQVGTAEAPQGLRSLPGFSKKALPVKVVDRRAASARSGREVDVDLRRAQYEVDFYARRKHVGEAIDSFFKLNVIDPNVIPPSSAPYRRQANTNRIVNEKLQKALDITEKLKASGVIIEAEFASEQGKRIAAPPVRYTHATIEPLKGTSCPQMMPAKPGAARSQNYSRFVASAGLKRHPSDQRPTPAAREEYEEWLASQE